MPPSYSKKRLLPRYASLLVLVVAIAIGSCAKNGSTNGSDFDSGANVDQGGDDATIVISPLGDATPASDSGISIIVRPDGSNDKCVKLNPCHDFPKDPQFDGTAPMNAPTMFGAPGTGSMTGGPCLAEPADGALYPKNWLRPRVLWLPASSAQTLFEVRIHEDGEENDYVIYTDKTSWTMPIATWKAIAYTAGPPAIDGNLVGRTLSVTVRGMSPTGGPPSISSAATFTIAPAIADGALIYWTTSSFANTSTNTTLQGFHVGDEGTTQALVASQVQQPVRAQSDAGLVTPAAFNPVFCIGCHTATPDGKYVSFSSQWPWANALASVETGPTAPPVGSAPPWLTTGASSNLSPNINGYYAPPAVNQIMMGIQTFSPAHYKQGGDMRLVSAIGSAWNQTDVQIKANLPGAATGVVSQLAWFDLEWAGLPPPGTPYNPWAPGPNAMNASPLPLATPCTSTNPAVACATPGAPGGGWGIIARTGDSNSAGAPNWSHNLDGNTDIIAYASTNLGTKDGRMDCELTGPTCASDVYVVPYNAGAGGQAKAVPGASQADQNEYYPAWSPDDKLIAFNRVPAGTSMYNEEKADIYVVPYNGGMGGLAMPLKSNDPVACTGAAPHTVQNTWPKWAPNPLVASPDAGADGGTPTPQSIAGKTYYWITFSSTRSPQAPTDPGNKGKRKQQLYVAGVVVDNATQNITTFSPIYLWNQDFTVNNLIPAWGEFSIPPGTTPPPFEAGIAK